MKKEMYLWGFTLVELLVVIAIIGILIALLLPAVQAAREAARRMQCSDHLKNVALAAHNYHDVYKTLPPGSSKGDGGPTWALLLLPYIEQQPLYAKYNIKRVAWDTTVDSGFEANNFAVLKDAKITIYTCPSDGGDLRSSFWPSGFTEGCYHHNYLCCSGDAAISNTSGSFVGTWFTNIPYNAAPANVQVFTHGGMFAMGTSTAVECYKFTEITDGTSNTLAFGEGVRGQWSGTDARGNDLRGFVWWANGAFFTGNLAPNSSIGDQGHNDSKMTDTLLPKNRFPIGPNARSHELFVASRSYHTGGVQTAFGDGSVSFQSDTVNIDVWRAMCSSRGAENVSK